MTMLHDANDPEVRASLRRINNRLHVRKDGVYLEDQLVAPILEREEYDWSPVSYSGDEVLLVNGHQLTYDEIVDRKLFRHEKKIRAWFDAEEVAKALRLNMWDNPDFVAVDLK